MKGIKFPVIKRLERRHIPKPNESPWLQLEWCDNVCPDNTEKCLQFIAIDTVIKPYKYFHGSKVYQISDLINLFPVVATAVRWASHLCFLLHQTASLWG